MSWKSQNRKPPSGLVHSWKLWRHCCCRYGWYPLLVAPIITTATLLSLYSTAGCDFIRVTVGFTPSNEAWNQSTAELGIIHMQSDLPGDDRYKEMFFEGCREYASDFDLMFIDDDRTWTVARIMSFIAAVAGIIATATIWMFVITPIPSCFFWPAILLPALMSAFLAEGSKFLFFDTAICRNTIWFPSGADSLPRVAESCELGTSGKFAIAAGAAYFLCLIIVCLHAPEQRELEVNYGTDFDVGESEMDSAMERGESDSDKQQRKHSIAYGEDTDEFCDVPLDAETNSDHSEIGPQTGQEISFTQKKKSRDRQRSKASGSTTSKDPARKALFGDDASSGVDSSRDPEDDAMAARLKALDSTEEKHASRQKTIDDAANQRYPTKPVKKVDVDDDLVKKPAPTIAIMDRNVSESRVNTIEKLEINTEVESDVMIEKFVADLNKSFQVDGADVQTTSNIGCLNFNANAGSAKNATEKKIESTEVEGSGGEPTVPTPSNTCFQTLCVGIPPNAGEF